MKRFLRYVFMRHFETDLESEIQEHIDEKVEAHRSAGLPIEEARARIPRVSSAAEISDNPLAGNNPTLEIVTDQDAAQLSNTLPCRISRCQPGVLRHSRSINLARPRFRFERSNKQPASGYREPNDDAPRVGQR